MTPLHCHSTFSFYAGVCTPEELACRARELGYTACGLADTDRVSGLIRFYNACKKNNIAPILGVELSDPACPLEHVVIIARNATGYADLCELVTRRKTDAGFSFDKDLNVPWPNLIFMTAFPRVLTLLAATPNTPYAELNYHLHDSRARIAALCAVAQQHTIECVASASTFFLEPADWETHRVLAAIGAVSTISRLLPHEYAPAQAFLHSPDQSASLFDNPPAVECADRIGREYAMHLPRQPWIMPRIVVPGDLSAEDHLAGIARSGLETLYKKTPEYARAKEIQEMELAVINKLGYASYFLIVKEIHSWASARFAGGFRSPSDCVILRGSAANSITFYTLGVSTLDPVKHDLYFQRFLNEDRASPPDADLDFGWDERAEVIDHIIETYGRDRVAITCTTNHFRRRAAFRETAKVLGHSDQQVTTMLTEGGRARQFDPAGDAAAIAALAKRITGKPRFLGQHPGGILITNDPIYRHVACEAAPGRPGCLITQIDMHNGIDDLGLIKFDILGNGSLSVLRDTLGQIHRQGLPDPGVHDIDKCITDPAVQEMIRAGKTRGIFYIESPAQMRLNAKAQAGTFEEVTITSSLVRPAATAYTEQFVARHREFKQGLPRSWTFLHPSLEPILGRTHDVCAFQEDITRICREVAGLEFAQADMVRKMMNSLHEGILSQNEYRTTATTFIDGCISRSGLTAAQAQTLWERVSSFTGFSFCKSHSASYAQLSFKCAWLKRAYPAQFLAAVASNNHGFYSKDVYLDEARRCGVRILPIDINESVVSYFGKHTWLRAGLMDIRGIRSAALLRIVAQRTDGGAYKNLADFVGRVDIHKQEIAALIRVGAFDRFGLSRPQHLFMLDDLFGRVDDAVPQLFVDTPAVVPSFLSDWSYAEKCLQELELTGFMCSGNILDILDLHPAARGTIGCASLAQHVNRRVAVFGWPVTNRTHYIESQQRAMYFLTIADVSECCDVVFWADVFARYSSVLESPGPYRIRGTVAQEYGTYTLVAESVAAVEWSPAIVDFGRASERLARSYAHTEHIHGISSVAAA